MHFTGRTWRPPYEASSFIVQVTSGCTHNKCHFCSLYKNECFRMSPIQEFEEDLAELQKYQPTARRIFLTGANPFVMSYENLVKRALLVHDYLVECQNIAMFSSIRDIKSKKVWQLRRLRALGINGLSIGTESGDDATLLLANKGYTAKELIEQCRKLDDARMEYYFVYMTGLAGKGNGYRNAVNSAKVFSIAASGATNFRIMFSTYVLQGSFMIAVTLFQSLGKAKKATWLVLFRQIILFIPLCVVLPMIGGMGIRGVWLAIALTDAILVVITVSMMLFEFRKLPATSSVNR